MISLEFTVGPDAVVRTIYSDLALPVLGLPGKMTVRRASHVEPDGKGGWIADMGPSGGPVLTGFRTHASAIEAEIGWLQEHKGL